MKDPAVYAADLPVGDPAPVTTYYPVRLAVPGRPLDLDVKVTAPATGTALPVLLLSHGHGPSTYVPSAYGYGPLVNFWAAHGFVVLQPTHLDATYLQQRDNDDPDAPLYLHARADDLRQVIDHLDVIEQTVPGLAGRLDRTRIAAVGHSAGGHTIGLLSGAGDVTATGERVSSVEDRIGARVMIAPPGLGHDLDGPATEHYPALGHTTFDTMTPPVLVVTGENDHNAFFSSRESWRSDAYTASPAPTIRLDFTAAEHSIGGITAFDAAETTDEDPDRVAVVRAMIWAYLRSTLYPGDTAWNDAQAALAAMPTPPAAVHIR